MFGGVKKPGPALPKQWHVYIVRTQSGKLYTGITVDLKRRFKQHMSGCGGAKFFNISGPAELVYSESAINRSMALKREAEIKRMRRAQKIRLIGN